LLTSVSSQTRPRAGLIRVYPSVTPERYIFRVTIGSILGFCDARDEG
jgi:hypothetical protein